MSASLNVGALRTVYSYRREEVGFATHLFFFYYKDIYLLKNIIGKFKY